MKRILKNFLCFLLVICMLAAPVAAIDGQAAAESSATPLVTPIVDGVVNEGEYTSSKVYSNSLQFQNSPAIVQITEYASHDADYVYFALVYDEAMSKVEIMMNGSEDARYDWDSASRYGWFTFSNINANGVSGTYTAYNFGALSQTSLAKTTGGKTAVEIKISKASIKTAYGVDAVNALTYYAESWKVSGGAKVSNGTYLANAQMDANGFTGREWAIWYAYYGVDGQNEWYPNNWVLMNVLVFNETLPAEPTVYCPAGNNCTMPGHANRSSVFDLADLRAFGLLPGLFVPELIDLSHYSVIYDADVSADLFADSARILAQTLESASAGSDAQSATPVEILIGQTNRPESTAALALLEDDGFAITKAGNKIAIVGTNTAHTLCGVNYFIENYVADGIIVGLPNSVVIEVSEIELLSSTAFGYTFVYDADLDDEQSSPYGNDTGRDYICIAVDDLRQLLSSESDLSLSSFTKKTDTAPASSKEIIVGNADRAEYSELIATLDANEYAIAIVGNKVILAAWNEKSMEACVSDFEELLYDVKETVSGKTVWNLPSDFYAKGIADEAWMTDFPRPDDAANIELTRSIDANNDSLQLLYTGSGVSASAFEAYCQTLVNAGYTMLTTNTVENSIFRLYVNQAKGIVLNVAYNDYKYADDFFSAQKQASEGKYYIEYEKSIRVTSSPIDTFAIPDSSITTPNPTYTKVADSAITTVGLEMSVVGMCYIIRLEDGSFVIYDGGYDNPSVSTEDLIWDTLVDLHTEAYGSAPTSSNPIRIAAWIITHSHYDHFAATVNMLNKYGTRADFRMDYLIGTFPATNLLYPSTGMEQDTAIMGGIGYIEKIQGYVNNAGAGTFKFLKAFSGQKLYFANLELEVLMTYEDHPTAFYDTNDTSTITRVSIASTSAADGSTTSASGAANTTTALFLGDALTYQSRYLCAMYGSYLESDMVQMAHHANNGCEAELYATVNPSVLLIANTVDTARSYLNGTSASTQANSVGIYVMNELESVEYIIVSNENYATTLTLGVNGPEYNSLYDIWTDTALSFKTSINSSWNGYLQKN